MLSSSEGYFTLPSPPPLLVFFPSTNCQELGMNNAPLTKVSFYRQLSVDIKIKKYKIKMLS